MSPGLESNPKMLQRSSSLWRRLSRRDVSKASSEPPTAPRKLQKRQTERVIPPEKKALITHMQRIDVPYGRTYRRTVDSEAASSQRVLASDMQTAPFPREHSSRIHTVTWDIYLSPEQVYSLVMGFKPQQREDKWFVFSEGPDGSGKLKVHFHRSWTGIKIAELFVLIDLKGEGAGKIVGIKWNSSEQTNGLDEEEAKYMIATTCAWVLGVHLGSGDLPKWV